jgi:hypothetical protein
MARTARSCGRTTSHRAREPGRNERTTHTPLLNMSEPRGSDRKRTQTQFFAATETRGDANRDQPAERRARAAAIAKAYEPLGGLKQLGAVGGGEGRVWVGAQQPASRRPCSRSTSASRQPGTTSTAGSSTWLTSTATAACNSLPALVAATAVRRVAMSPGAWRAATRCMARARAVASTASSRPPRAPATAAAVAALAATAARLKRPARPARQRTTCQCYPGTRHAAGRSTAPAGARSPATNTLQQPL